MGRELRKFMGGSLPCESGSVNSLYWVLPTHVCQAQLAEAEDRISAHMDQVRHLPELEQRPFDIAKLGGSNQPPPLGWRE